MGYFRSRDSIDLNSNVAFTSEDCRKQCERDSTCMGYSTNIVESELEEKNTDGMITSSNATVSFDNLPEINPLLNVTTETSTETSQTNKPGK